MSRKREQILRRAEQEFLVYGYVGTSIDSIVKDIGGSKSTVYAHFSDKTVLFAEAITDIRREFDFSLPRSLAVDAEDPGVRLELAVVEFLTMIYRERAIHLFRLVISEANRFPEVAHQYWHEGPVRSLDRLAEIIGSRDTAVLLFNMLMGERYHRVVLALDPIPDPEQIVSIARYAIATAAQGSNK